MKYLDMDKKRYSNGKIYTFQKMFRKYRDTDNKLLKLIYKVLFRYYRNKNLIDMSIDTKIGEGLYIGHPYCITSTQKQLLGKTVIFIKELLLVKKIEGCAKGLQLLVMKYGLV